MPNTLGWNVTTAIDSVIYPHGVTSTFNLAMGPLGSNSFLLSYSGDTSQPATTVGQIIHLFRIVSSSLGTTINPGSFRSVKADATIGGSIPTNAYVGLLNITATTSVDACTNFDPETIYRVNNNILNVGSRVFSGLTGNIPVNGNNSWVAFIAAPQPTKQTISGTLLYDTKKTVQIDTSGYIIDVNTC
jgi:hypothetical protein